ncbi:protein fantom [Stylonychia lemnae]|uniref:Protein fantom n=1 Tax=Stylonychia lemnae TaxID=5949 RepID=A0A078AWZ4_STYLE|nr:protein fantom [Stylonychia lemnae]|eukprot:CDW86689.1 protein fantom [Stylonychia lemnae]
MKAQKDSMRDDDYSRRREQMNSNIEHHGHCIPSKERKKNKSPKKKDIKPDFKNVNEKLLVLRDENIHLKSKKQELEDDVKLQKYILVQYLNISIAAKLKRQINTLKKDRILGAGGQLYNKIDEDLDKMIEDNLRLQDEEQDLTRKVKKLQKLRQTHISSTNTEINKKLRKTTDGYDVNRSRSPNKNHEFVLDVQSYRQHIEKSQKQIMELQREIEMSKRATTGSIAPEELIMQLREKELKVAQQKAKLEDLNDNLKLRYEMFSQNEAYQNGLIAELKQLKQDYIRLLDDNRSFEQQAELAKQFQQEVEEAQKQRDELQQQFGQVTKQPFFKREMDQNAFQQNNSLQNKSEELDKLIKDSKANFMTIDEEIRKLKEEEKNLKIDRDIYQDEIDRMRMQMDPSNLSLAEIQRRIHELDPSMFRQVMKDLHYDGDEPVWAKFDFLERLRIGPNNQPIDENDPHQLTKEIQRLKTEKSELAAELERVQKLLKMLVSVDKEHQDDNHKEINRLKSLIIGENQKINDLNLMINARSQKLLTITKQGGFTHGQLTAAGLAQLDQELEKLRHGVKDDDVLTEFSAVTDNSEISPQENYLDLIVSKAQFDKQRLSQLLGNRELLPGAVHTFISVDFYNHDSKPGPVSEGFEPNFSTQFCFKNNVDDFYVQYLEEKYITIDVFLQRAQKFLKIGTARLVLSKILERDLTFQAQEILYEGGELGSTFSIGKIFYKMRMRKPIDEAIKWYQQRVALKKKRDPNTIINQYSQNIDMYAKRKQKAITIQIVKCFDLRRPGQQYNSKQMMPFFHYTFFTFQYISPVLQGNSPIFEIQKTYEFELNDQFFEYMKSQILKIDFMDESVDLDSNQNDYIGSVRIPLNQLLVNEEFEDTLGLVDTENNETGKVQIRISCKDFTPYPYELNERDLDVEFKMSKITERDIILKIAKIFAESNSDIEIIFDMLLENGENNKISKQRFKTYLLQFMRVQEKEIDIFLKTNRYIQNKEYIELADFKNIFEIYILEARQKLYQEQNELQRKYKTAQSFNQSNSMGYGMQTTQNIKNPFMRDTINQRVNDTPGFEGYNQGFGSSSNRQQEELHKQLTNLSNYSGKAKMELEQKSKSILDIVKQQAYHLINEFQSQLPKGQEYASFEQYRQIFDKYCPNSDDVISFFGDHQIEMKFYFYETIMRISMDKVPDGRAPLLQLQQHQSRTHNPRINYIKEKIQKNLVSQGLDLHTLFKFLDKDKSKTLTIGELTMGMKNYLDDKEALELFMAIDKDNSNSISIDEIINECSMIHCVYVLDQLKKAIQTGVDLSVEKVFETVDNNKNGEMDIFEFNEMITLLHKDVEKFEVDAIFKHFDIKGTGKISKEDFKKALTVPMTLENKLKFVLHDFMTPIKTLMKKKKMTPEGLFEKFSRDKKVITIQDFKEIVKYLLQFELSEEETNLVINAINGFYAPEQSGVLTKLNFTNFFYKDFVVKSFASGNDTIARQALIRIKSTNQGKGIDMRKAIQPFLDSMAQSIDNQQAVINIRNLKMYLNCTYNLSTYDIENIIEYLDRDHNGFVGVLDFEKAVELR